MPKIFGPATLLTSFSTTTSIGGALICSSSVSFVLAFLAVVLGAVSIYALGSYFKTSYFYGLDANNYSLGFLAASALPFGKAIDSLFIFTNLSLANSA